MTALHIVAMCVMSFALGGLVEIALRRWWDSRKPDELAWWRDEGEQVQELCGDTEQTPSRAVRTALTRLRGALERVQREALNACDLQDVGQITCWFEYKPFHEAIRDIDAALERGERRE